MTELIAVEPEPHLREHAERAARQAPVPITVIDAVAEELPFPDASFDAAVASLMLCSVADVPAALAELHRVLRPAGELRFFEHVASPHRACARASASGRRDRLAAAVGRLPPRARDRPR